MIKYYQSICYDYLNLLTNLIKAIIRKLVSSVLRYVISKRISGYIINMGSKILYYKSTKALLLDSVNLIISERRKLLCVHWNRYLSNRSVPTAHISTHLTSKVKTRVKLTHNSFLLTSKYKSQKHFMCFFCIS